MAFHVTLALHSVTKHVLGVVSAISSATRELKPEDVIGEGVVFRRRLNGDPLLTLPAENIELASEEVDEDVLLQPLSYSQDDSGNLVLANPVTAVSVTLTAAEASVVFTNAPAGEKRTIWIQVEYIPSEQRIVQEMEQQTSPANIPMPLVSGRAYGVIALISGHRGFAQQVTAT